MKEKLRTMWVVTVSVDGVANRADGRRERGKGGKGRGAQEEVNFVLV